MAKNKARKFSHKKSKADIPVEIRRFPSVRKIIVDTGEQGRQRHHMRALLELDVSVARQKIAEIKRDTQAPFSFTGWLAYCIGRSIQEYPEVHAILCRNKIYIFKEVDISLIVEREIDGILFPAIFVIKDTGHKSLSDINEEIQAAKHISQEEHLKQTDTKGTKFLVALPKLFRKVFFWKKLRGDPFMQKRLAGTVNITSVGMFGSTAGWPLIDSTYPMSIAVGSIVRKPWNVDGQIQLREILHLTVLIDHDVVDGAPAARFLQVMVQRIQNAAGLGENL